MDFEVAGTVYRATLLDARSQFFFLKRLKPLFPALDGVGAAFDARDKNSLAAISPLTNANEDDLAFVMDVALATCQRFDGEGWRPATDEADRLDLADVLQVVGQVVAFNFGPFFALERPTFLMSSYGTPFEPVSMPNGTDWFYRPVLRGLCSFADLKDGTLHIEDVAEMNDLLDVTDENQRRAQKAAENERR